MTLDSARRTFAFWFLVAAVVPIGCGYATFLQTAPDYQPSARDEDPMVYIDHLPQQEYRSVGIIEVTAHGDIQEIVRLAVALGKKKGCDVLVDRSVHPVSLSPTELPILATHNATDDDLRPRSRSEATIQRGAQAAYTTTQYNPPPPTKREFVCGVYPRTDPSASPTNTPAAMQVWRVATAGAKKHQLCDTTFDILKGDAECRGEGCHAPVLLAEEFLSRCAAQQAEYASRVSRWKTQWEARRPKELGVSCLAGLLRARTSDSVAQAYARRCIQDREPGHLEYLLLKGTAPPPSSSPAPTASGSAPFQQM